MALIEDATLIAKKIAVSILIYSIPVAIIVGGLLLTKHLLVDNAPNTTITNISQTKP